jgi:hypothetical protein
MLPITDLSGIQFLTLNSAGINDKGPENYNNTEVRGNFLHLPQSTWHLLL